MRPLQELLEEYDRLGDVSFSSSHDFVLRQRKLEDWAMKARQMIAALAAGDDMPEARSEPKEYLPTGS